MSKLEAVGITKRFRAREVVKHLSLSIESGDVVGLLGPNGAGKTTAFYMIAGLTSCDHGNIVLNGQDITRLPVHRRAKLGLGYLPQEASVFRKLLTRASLPSARSGRASRGAHQRRSSGQRERRARDCPKVR